MKVYIHPLHLVFQCQSQVVDHTCLSWGWDWRGKVEATEKIPTLHSFIPWQVHKSVSIICEKRRAFCTYVRLLTQSAFGWDR